MTKAQELLNRMDIVNEAFVMKDYMSYFTDFNYQLGEFMVTLNNNLLRKEIPEARALQKKVTDLYNDMIDIMNKYTGQ